MRFLYALQLHIQFTLTTTTAALRPLRMRLPSRKLGKRQYSSRLSETSYSLAMLVCTKKVSYFARGNSTDLLSALGSLKMVSFKERNRQQQQIYSSGISAPSRKLLRKCRLLYSFYSSCFQQSSPTATVLPTLIPMRAIDSEPLQEEPTVAHIRSMSTKQCHQVIYQSSFTLQRWVAAPTSLGTVPPTIALPTYLKQVTLRIDCNILFLGWKPSSATIVRLLASGYRHPSVKIHSDFGSQWPLILWFILENGTYTFLQPTLSASFSDLNQSRKPSMLSSRTSNWTRFKQSCREPTFLISDLAKVKLVLSLSSRSSRQCSTRQNQSALQLYRFVNQFFYRSGLASSLQKGCWQTSLVSVATKGLTQSHARTAFRRWLLPCSIPYSLPLFGSQTSRSTLPTYFVGSSLQARMTFYLTTLSPQGIIFYGVKSIWSYSYRQQPIRLLQLRRLIANQSVNYAQAELFISKPDDTRTLRRLPLQMCQETMQGGLRSMRYSPTPIVYQCSLILWLKCSRPIYNNCDGGRQLSHCQTTQRGDPPRCANSAGLQPHVLPPSGGSKAGLRQLQAQEQTSLGRPAGLQQGHLGTLGTASLCAALRQAMQGPSGQRLLVLHDANTFGLCPLRRKVLLRLFDFQNSSEVNLRKMSVIFRCFIFGYSTVVGSPLPSEEDIRLILEDSFLKTDLNLDSALSHRELVNWLESNSAAIQIFRKYEPVGEVPKSSFEVFSKLHCLTPGQANALLTKLESVFTDVNYKAVISETYHGKRHVSEHIKRGARTQQSVEKLRRRAFPPLNSDRWRPGQLDRSRATVVPKAVNRQRAIQIKEYFDHLSSQQDRIRIREFTEAIGSRSISSKNMVASAMFSFLDEQKSGEVTFRQLVKKLVPGIEPRELRWVEGISRDYENTFRLERVSQNEREMEELEGFISKMKGLPERSIGRLRRLFDSFDEGRKGFITFKDLKKHFVYCHDQRDLESIMNQYDSDKDGKLSFIEFVRLILPRGFQVEGLDRADIRR